MSRTPTSSPYKPSPLSFNSPRSSPFRRPESPFARSPSTIRAGTPSASPTKADNNHTNGPDDRTATPSRAGGAAGASLGSPEKTSRELRARSPLFDMEANDLDATTARPPPPTARTISNASSSDSSSTRPLPTRTHTERTIIPATTTTRTDPFTSSSPSVPRTTTTLNSSTTAPRGGTDPLTTLHPQHLHNLRESFTLLDRQSTGAITPQDLIDTLTELGLDASPSALNNYASSFPSLNGPSGGVNLSTYLSTLAALLAPLGNTRDVLGAFSAFDEHDSGEVDLGELRDAVLNTAPERGERSLSEREVDSVLGEFAGRRAFGSKGGNGGGGGSGKGRGEVFRYGDFVASYSGAGGQQNGGVEGGVVGK